MGSCRLTSAGEDSAVKASVFIATSLDGFIARTNGELDWLPPGGGEPHGYDEFMATVDALVVGRKTFETALTFGTWPYGAKPGIPLFGALQRDVVLRHVGTRQYAGGLVQSEYVVAA